MTPEEVRVLSVRIAMNTVHHIVEYDSCFWCGGGIGRSRETDEWMHLFDFHHKAAPEDETFDEMARLSAAQHQEEMNDAE